MQSIVDSVLLTAGNMRKGAEDFSRPCCLLCSDTQAASETAWESWSGSVRGRDGRSDESMFDTVRADVISGNETVVLNRGDLRALGARHVNGSEDTPGVDKPVGVAQRVVIPSSHLTSIIDAERNGIGGARGFDVAEDAVHARHGVSEAPRHIGGKPADVSALIDPIQPGAERARKADAREDAVLPDEPVWRIGTFRRDASDPHRLPSVVHLDDCSAC